MIFGFLDMKSKSTFGARLDNYKRSITGLLDLWPDVVTEDALLVRDGGREACWVSRPHTHKMLFGFQLFYFIFIDIMGLTRRHKHLYIGISFYW